MDDLVSIYRGARAEANVIVGMLHANGVDAVLSSDDAGGVRPDVGFVQGTRVLVRSSDVEVARQLLAEVEPLRDS